ncbi:MAG: M3 family metallopeptidase [Acidobacteriota bacterium]|nr:M3 family metallopeptidase [Acidobacteriota bacterium]
MSLILSLRNMRLVTIILIIGVIVLFAVACSRSGKKAPESSAGRNVLLDAWSGPYGGVPPFDRVKVEYFKPALETAMAEALAEIDKIAANPEAPTFENTIAAMERSGKTLDRVLAVYNVYSDNMSSDAFRAVEKEMAPKLAEYRDTVMQNARLFERIEKVYNARESSGLTPEQQRLVWDYYTDFVREGAKLSPEHKAAVAKINKQLADLYTKFSNNLLHDEESYALYLTKDQLGGLPESYVKAAAEAAAERGQAGKYAVLNTRSSMDPFLTYSTHRDLREKVWRTYYSRGDNADAYDNNKIISEILRLRAERTKLQGYPSFAHRALEKQVAKTPDAAMALMTDIWPAAVARVKEEVADMQAIANKEGAKLTIEPWDYRFYAEKVRKAKYDLDSNEVKEYLQLEKLREAMMWTAGKLYGFEFVPVSDVPVFHPDVRVWEVKRNGKHIGLWYFDPYARPGKRSGAWMSDYRSQDRMDGEVTTIVSNNSNFVKGAPGEPVLISWDDAETMFHEFGHALHGLSSNVTYPSLSGTSVARDYVELPSQINEHWLSTPEVLNQFALHYKTGKAIPKELVAKIDKASKFNQGFATTEFLASALVDMKLHMLPQPVAIDPDTYERETLKALGMPKELPMRHRMPQFSHIFSGEGYAAGYYSYLWADALTADAWEAFQEGKGPYDEAVAKSFFDNILSKGNTVDPAVAFRAFRGRDVDTDALMRDRGFPVK